MWVRLQLTPVTSCGSGRIGPPASDVARPGLDARDEMGRIRLTTAVAVRRPQRRRTIHGRRHAGAVSRGEIAFGQGGAHPYRRIAPKKLIRLRLPMPSWHETRIVHPTLRAFKDRPIASSARQAQKEIASALLARGDPRRRWRVAR